MGNFDKKRAFGIGGLVTVLVGGVAFLANVSEIVQLFKPEKTENSVAVIETVKEESEETIVEEENVAEVVEVSVVESAEVTEEMIIEQEESAIVQEEIIVPETVPPTESPTESQPSVVYLDNLKIIESQGYFEDVGSAEDTISNKYVGHIITVGRPDWIETDYMIYYLGGKYKTLSGTIAVDNETDDGYGGELSISCDDDVIYSTGKMGRISVPTEFSISVEGCQWLKINHDYACVKFILSDWKLEE
ncbi:MAG: NPCBM/NEW2 domain-containing protein [Ruminococcus sp.]|nr:NPCBM/NEW2 domain-containing protein [Ruminococcus sp.]